MLIRRPLPPERRSLFFSVDFGGGELVTHAESCVNLVGYSRMGEALNRGIDVHAALGATMMGRDFEWFWHALKKLKDARCKGFRQASKPPNFGFPGGMGAVKLVLQQRKQGPDTPCPNGPSMVYDEDLELFVPGYKGLRFCILVDGATRCGVNPDGSSNRVTEWKKRPYPPTCRHCIDVAERLRKAWFRQWPENEVYLGNEGPVNQAVDGPGETVHHVSKRIRGVTEFCSAANGWFQGYLADITKHALCRVSYEQYVQTRVASIDPDEYPSRFEGELSPLFGSRTIVAIHDELLGEAPETYAPEAADRLSEVMCESFRLYCPRHKPACKAPPALARRWWKSMEEVRDANGRLLPWEPKKPKRAAA